MAGKKLNDEEIETPSGEHEGEGEGAVKSGDLNTPVVDTDVLGTLDDAQKAELLQKLGFKKSGGFFLPDKYDPNLDPRAKARQDKLLSESRMKENVAAEYEKLKEQHTDLQKQLDEMKRSQMSESEKTLDDLKKSAAQIEILRMERESVESKLRDKELETMKVELLADMGLLKFRRFVTATDEDGIKAQIQALKSEMDAEIERQVEELKIKSEALERGSPISKSTKPPVADAGGSQKPKGERRIFKESEVEKFTDEDWSKYREEIKKQIAEGIFVRDVTSGSRRFV